MGELKEGFLRLRLSTAPETMEKLFSLADADGNGAIDFAEFCALFSLLRPVDLFHVFQSSDDGQLLADLRNAGRPVLHKEVRLTMMHWSWH